MTVKRFWVVFLAGLLVKVLVMPLTSSHYTRDLFIPFLDTSLLHWGQNPWSLTPPEAFPYGAVLFVILLIPKAIGYALFGAAALGTGALGSFLFKLPVLLADCLLFWGLNRRFPAEKYRLLLFYWLNPVLLYINYVLGQVDLLSMTFLIFSCFALFRNRVFLSGLLVGCAIACKFHTLIAFPLILLYLWRSEFWPRVAGKMILWLATAAITILLGMYLPVEAGQLGYVTLASPEALRLFSMSISWGEDLNLYLGFVFVLVVLGRLLVTQRVTEQGLFFGLGIIFHALVLVTNPMPSWFLWFLPFAAVFYAQYRLVHWALPLTQMILYFIHFVVLPEMRPSQIVVSICLTLLQASTAAQLALLWFYIVRNEYPLSGRLRPMIIGIAGDSGAGKNRLSEALSHVFDVGQASFVEGDDYHKWERGNENWKQLTHLSPRANFLDTLSRHTLALSSGRTVLQPHYDHSTGRFTAPRSYKPGQTIIVQGLHTLYPKSMRDAMDLKVFVNPDPLIRLSWKIKRDVGERNYSMDRVIQSLRAREVDGRRFIEPQRFFADWIIEATLVEKINEDEVIAGVEPAIKVRHILWNDSPVNQLVEAFAGIGTLDAKVDLLEGDINRVALEVSGTISSSEVASLAKNLFPMLRSLTRAPFYPRWLENFDGINQIIALSLLNWNDLRGVNH